MDNEEKIMEAENNSENTVPSEMPEENKPPMGARPEPPKDENGNPMAPPEGGRPPRGSRPEPPKDENGNTITPPEQNDI